MHTSSVRDKYLAVKDLPFCLTMIQRLLLHHFLKESCSNSSYVPTLSAGTLSVCVNERFADPHLHTMALQFLRTVFTEETKSQGVEVTTSHSAHASTLSDIVIGPSASQLCELLLQVHGSCWQCRSWMDRFFSFGGPKRELNSRFCHISMYLFQCKMKPESQLTSNCHSACRLWKLQIS